MGQAGFVLFFILFFISIISALLLYTPLYLFMIAFQNIYIYIYIYIVANIISLNDIREDKLDSNPEINFEGPKLRFHNVTFAAICKECFEDG